MNIRRHSVEWWEDFWKASSFDFGQPRADLLALAKRFKKQKSSLPLKAIDIGSGNGRYALSLARLGYETSALELTESGCELIKNRCQNEKVQIAILQRDILNTFCEEPFDLVISSGLLEEIPHEQQTKAVENIKFYSRKSGLLILKYCLEISERGVTIKDGFVPDIFVNDLDWRIVEIKTDPILRKSIANINFENRVRTETIIARRVN